MTQDEKYMLESIYHNSQETVQMSPNLAQDTINVTLNMAGYDIGAMNQFEKAHALMDMAMELKALASARQCDAISLAHYEDVFDKLLNEVQNVRKVETQGGSRLSSRR